MVVSSSSFGPQLPPQEGAAVVTTASATATSPTQQQQLLSRLNPFRRDRSRDTSLLSMTKKSVIGGGGADSKMGKMMIKRRNQRTNSKNSDNIKCYGGVRSSTSTHLTDTAQSSLFLMEPSAPLRVSAIDHDPTVSNNTDTLLAVEMPTQSLEEPVAELAVDDMEDITSLVVARPFCRLPPPESYYELIKNEYDELGYLHLEFDSLQEAKEEAARREQPILCIEVQIPGGSIIAGETVLSHPLIVEAMESLFVTVRPTPEEPTDERSRFFRDSSCRTRIRILDEEGMDIVPCVEHLSSVEVLTAMVQGLEACAKHIPRYLLLLNEEASGQLEVLSKDRFREVQRSALFGMFDSTKAEVELGGLGGVLSTRAGMVTRQKVVQVTYDTRRLSYCTLVRYALRHAGVNIVYYETNEERLAAQMEAKRYEECLHRRQQQQQEQMDSDVITEEGTAAPPPFAVPIKVTERIGNMRANHNPKPSLRDSILRFVPLTNLQACKANRLIYLNRFNEAMHLLSPRQGLIAMKAVRQHYHTVFRDVVDVPIDIAWKELTEQTLQRQSRQ